MVSPVVLGIPVRLGPVLLAAAGFESRSIPAVILPAGVLLYASAPSVPDSLLLPAVLRLVVPAVDLLRGIRHNRPGRVRCQSGGHLHCFVRGILGSRRFHPVCGLRWMNGPNICS